MFKKLMALTLVCLMMVTMLAGCKAQLIGKWENEEGVVMTLEKDGTGSISEGGMSIEFEWEVEKDEFTIKMEVLGQESEETMEYEVKGKTLILDDEEWTKVKK